MPRYDYVLLDADNTLFDFDLAEHKALGLTLASHGIPFTPEAEQTYIDINTALWSKFDRGEISQGELVVERFSAFLRAVGRAGDPAELNRYYLSRLGEQGDLLPGAEALCRALAARCTLAIITNGVSSAQRGRFARSPIQDCISHLFISEDIGFQKPRREFFDAVLHDMGISDPGRAVVVGDTLGSDILGAKNAGLDELCDVLEGTTSIAICEGDPVAAAKVVAEFSKKLAAQEKFVIKSGFVDGKVISVDEVKALADLPSREVLVATVLGTLIAPVRGLATVLDANISGLARVMQAIADQKGA